MTPTAEEAREFFYQLGTFSQRFLRKIGITDVVSPYTGGRMRPTGAVVHYTADQDWERVLKVFMRSRYRSNVSAHAVVLEYKAPGHDSLAHDLPMIRDLPTTIVECVPRMRVAWHATWANAWAYGIENVNAGELRSRDGKFYTWWRRDQGAPMWTTRFESDHSTPQSAFGRYWQPYTIAQIDANVRLLRFLRALDPLDGTRIIGHEHIQTGETLVGGRSMSDKIDPGPLYPMVAVRDAVIWGGNEWIETFIDEGWHAHYARDALHALHNHTPSDRKPIAQAWGEFVGAMRAGRAERAYLKAALRILGYDCSWHQPDWTPKDRATLELFARAWNRDDLTSDAALAQSLRHALQHRGFIDGVESPDAPLA